MTSEVCPFCGKTYKRLKSHLPYCKAAASSKTHDATGEETSSSQLATASSQRKPKGKKSTQTLSVSTDLQTKKSKKVSVILSEAAQLQSQVSSSQSLSPSSTSLPLPATKKKQKLVDQIKMASMPPSATVSLVSSSPLVMCEAKNKSPRVSKEAAKSEHISKGSLKGTRSASEDLLSHLNTSTTVQTKINSVNDSMRDVGLLSDTTPQEGPRKKRSKTKKAAGSPLATKPPPDPLDVNINEASTTLHTSDFMVDNEEGTFLKLGSHQSRITLQDVKATLRRAKANNQSSRTSILSRIQTVDGPSDLTPVIVPAERQKGGYKGTAKSLTDIMPNTSSQQAQLLSDKENYLKSDQGSSVPLPVLQPKLNSPAPSLLSGPLVSQFSSPHPFLLPPPVRVDTSRADEASSPEKSQLDVGKQNTANSQTGGAVTQLRLGQVRLRELPEWLACKTPRNPKHAVEMVQRGWQWYHRRYINVKKGGVGGLGMLLAGYCVLSYIWSYPRIKLDRWRKYH